MKALISVAIITALTFAVFIGLFFRAQESEDTLAASSRSLDKPQVEAAQTTVPRYVVEQRKQELRDRKQAYIMDPEMFEATSTTIPREDVTTTTSLPTTTTNPTTTSTIRQKRPLPGGAL